MGIRRNSGQGNSGTIEVGGKVIQIQSKKLLTDPLPHQWMNQGITNIDLTILWRHLAQQMDAARIAQELCLVESQREIAEGYFRQRLRVVVEQIKTINVRKEDLRGMPKMLADLLY